MLTLVTPTLDAADFIERNLQSIDSLEIEVEHIIVDGGSKDQTLDIVQKYLGENRNLIHQTEKNGMYGALQLGFQAAKANLFAYVNADDRVIKEGFEKMYAKIRDTDQDLVYSDGYHYWTNKNEMEKVRGRRFGRYHLRNGYMPFLQPSSMYTRTIFERVEGFRYDIFSIAGDLDLFQRMALQDDFKAGYVPVASSIFLKHGNSLGDKNTDVYYKEMEKLKQLNRNLLNNIIFKISKFI